MSKGIDYGMGQTNIDPSNGIRYGVIPMNSLHEWAWDDFEPDYGEPTCPKCGNTANLETDKSEADYSCESCEYCFNSDEAYGDEPLGHTLESDEYTASVDSYGDVFIMKSPYFTRAQFCSPCAPGACHLDNPTDDGERAYCFGHDWFEGDKAPYPVYSVATGELVNP